MRSCSRCRKMMVGALYQELSPRRQRAFDAHLASCPDCAEEYQQLSWTLKVMDQRQAPAVDPAYWEGFWNRLSSRLEPEKHRTRLPDWRAWFPPVAIPVRPAWVMVTAAVLLVATGIFIGRSTYLSRTGAPTHARAAVLDPALVAEFNTLAGRYLERSKVILLGMDNFDVSEDDLVTLDFSRQQLLSQELVHQGRELKMHQVAATNEGLRMLIEEIERILMQLANSEGEEQEWTIRLIQDGIEKNSILLKITLEELGQSEAPAGRNKPAAGVKKSSVLI